MILREEVKQLEDDQNWLLMLEKSRQWCEFEPSNATAWFKVGVAAYRLKKYANALQAFKKSVTLNPDNAYTWVGLASIHVYYGDYPKAVVEYEKAEKIAPKDADILYALGCAYLRVESNKVCALLEKLDKLDSEKAMNLEGCLMGTIFSKNRFSNKKSRKMG